MFKNFAAAAAIVGMLGWGSAAYGAGAGEGSSTTTTTTNTINTNVGTVNAGSIYQGQVTVSGATSGTINYTWGQLRASDGVIQGLQGSLNSTSNTALNFYKNAVGTLPSNLELLTASAPVGQAFLYYDGSHGTGFEIPTNITDGANALGIENKVIGGRTASWSSSVSGPSNRTYAILATNTEELTQTDTTSVGDFVISSNTNYITNIFNYSGNANVSVYEVQASKYVSPIVLDIKGSGRLQASGGKWLPHPGKLDTERVITFDFNANGFDVMMEWVGPDDGLLVEPKADGTVDGSSLFGTTGGYLNGYEKLAVRDANNDKKLTGQELDGLFVWQDRNGNGKADDREVASVGSLNITEIGLNHTNFQSTFVMNGASRAMWDWWPNALNVRKVRVADINK
ncbi:MAG: hypothetical protein FJX76_11210 [Armatimonadetes bacterium]|nr:hypothetical protein [Armatimonadota bacterium]